jgi:hypothetical protein
MTDDIITHMHTTREWQDRFSWNLVWTLWHWRLLQTRTFYFPTVGISNVMDAKIHEVGGWSSFMMPLPKILHGDWWHHCPLCHLSVIIQIICVAIYQWSYELFGVTSIRRLITSPMLHLSMTVWAILLHSLCGFITQHNVLNCYAAMVTSEESLYTQNN